jgi:hypothetical protein
MWPNYKTDKGIVGRNTEAIAGGSRKINHDGYYTPILLIKKKNGMGGASSRYRPDDKRVKEFGR